MFHHAAGAITSGSRNVSVNGRAAAHVENSTVACQEHATVPLMAEGSTNIFINSKAAVRKGDKTTCDATVDSGSGNVIFDGGQQQYLDIEREISDDWRTASDVLFFVAGIAGGIFGAAWLKETRFLWQGYRLLQEQQQNGHAGHISTTRTRRTARWPALTICLKKKGRYFLVQYRPERRAAGGHRRKR